MLNRKISKVSHFLRSKVFEKNTVKSLSGIEGYGASVAQAFLKTLKKQHTPAEDQLFKMLGEFRQDLSVNKQKISFKEIGSDTEMTVAEVSRKAASPEIWTRFFYQLSKTKSVNNILEIGTNLGVSGQYFIKALEGKKNTKFTSLEGVKGLCEIATERFKVLSDINRFEVLQGLYDQTLIDIADRDDRFDLVFIDGNHQYEPTLKYFELLKNNLSDHSLIIFDDINWSEGMRKAWREICAQKGIVFSINLFKLGLIVFDANSTEISKNHYQLFLSV